MNITQTDQNPAMFTFTVTPDGFFPPLFEKHGRYMKYRIFTIMPMNTGNNHND
ncbi:MAG: hypothetical protein HGA62_03540 [Chlorobiaceae bacterium]|nr:hypothetical protein [Chlorobiaceae bacterium]NTV60975.1 hypothetical protein [Chlorobiaceae bacterium]